MTAFARVQESCEAGSVTWEIRSVNHRYLEPGLKLPEDFKALEPEIRKQVAKYLTIALSMVTIYDRSCLAKLMRDRPMASSTITSLNSCKLYGPVNGSCTYH